MTFTATPRNVLFLGTHGQFNIGDELLLSTFLGELGKQHRYAINSYAPAETMTELDGTYDVDVFDTAAGKVEILKRLRWADVVVFGGGSIIKELYASTGRWRYSTLLMVLGVVAAARFIFRVPILMSNIGVGPITSAPGRFLARSIVRFASLVSVRDRASLSLCERLGCSQSKVIQVPDAVFVNPPEAFEPENSQRSPNLASPDSEGSVIRIALNLNKDIENPDAWEPFLDSLACALQKLHETHPIHIDALAMQARFKSDNDFEVLEAFLARLPDIGSTLERPVTHRDVGAIIERCDLVVSERLHAIVIAAITAKPAVGLLYDIKVRELCQQLGISQRAIDINESVDPATITSAILETYDDAAGVATLMESAASRNRSTLHSYFGAVRDWISDPAAHNTWTAHNASTVHNASTTSSPKEASFR